MNETIVSIVKSKKKGKKYMATIKNKKSKRIRVLHFGGLGYQQYKDSSGVGEYSHLNHGDKRRRENYFGRHSKGNRTKKKAVSYEIHKSNGVYTPKLLSHIYLW